MNNIETRLEGTKPSEKQTGKLERAKDYVKGMFNRDNARLYGNFQQRTALNITELPKIHGSLLIRMGLVYPIMSSLLEYVGVPKDCHTDICGVSLNWHTYGAGYLAYLAEIEAGLSKYPIELVTRGAMKLKEKFRNIRSAQTPK